MVWCGGNAEERRLYISLIPTIPVEDAGYLTCQSERNITTYDITIFNLI